MCPHPHIILPYLPLVLLFWLTAASAQSVTDSRQPVSPVSIIDIPVRLSLEPLVNAAEKALPHQTGNWRTWKDWHGIKSQYRAWRGPLGISVSGDVLSVQAHIRYWIRARKKVLGTINLKGSCGIDEPPRQALIGMQVRLGWGPDWTLRPVFHILPTQFLDRCEMTIANIDVTPVIEKEFRKQMQNSLRAALHKLAPGMNAIRGQAQRSWSLLQEPVELGPGNRLMLRPTGVALSGITGRGDHIDAYLAITLQPALVTETEPVGNPVPLPPLERYYPRSGGLNIHLGVTLDFARLNQRLTDALAGKSFVIKGRSAVIKKLDLAGSGQKIRAGLELSGEMSGAAELRARVVYDAQTRKLQLQDLTFDYEAGDFSTALLVEVFHEPVRQALENAANQAMAEQLDRLGKRLKAVLKKITPAGVTLDMSTLQLRTVQIQILQQGIKLDGTATGNAHLVLH
jgi:hypothetical protein